MNLAEVGQSKIQHERWLWLTEAVKHDMVDLTYQTSMYKKFIKNSEKIMGRGPTLKKRTEQEHAEERRFVDQFCDVIQNGDLLEEREDPNDLDFMPSSRSKHRAPRNMDVGIQEKPKKKPAVLTTWKKSLPE